MLPSLGGGDHQPYWNFPQFGTGPLYLGIMTISPKGVSNAPPGVHSFNEYLFGPLWCGVLCKYWIRQVLKSALVELTKSWV